ncbi:EF-hand domain-containing protein [Roseivivax sp. CAU 1753]
MKPTFLFPLVLTTSLGCAALAQQNAPGAHFIENWDLDGDAQVTVEEATQKRAEIFRMFDQDENGALDGVEYDLFDETRNADMEENAGGAAGPMRGVSQAMSREFIDTDKDGLVTEAEFLSRVPAWFGMMDRDADQRITTSDFGPRKN